MQVQNGSKVFARRSQPSKSQIGRFKGMDEDMSDDQVRGAGKLTASMYASSIQNVHLSFTLTFKASDLQEESFLHSLTFLWINIHEALSASATRLEATQDVSGQ